MMTDTPPSEKPGQKETPPRYGIYGYELKREIMRSGRPVEIRAVIKRKRPASEDRPEIRSTLENAEVLISNQGTMAGEPKIIDGVHKKQIDDESIFFMTEEDFGRLQIDVGNVSLYAENGEKREKIDETVRAEISKRVSDLMQSLPPPPLSRRRFGRPF